MQRHRTCPRRIYLRRSGFSQRFRLYCRRIYLRHISLRRFGFYCHSRLCCRHIYPRQWKSNISSWSHPDKSLEREQFWPILKNCIANLPPQLAQTFVLREIDGLTSEEICEELEISSANNLWVMLSRARMRLRNCLDAHWFNNTTG